MRLGLTILLLACFIAGLFAESSTSTDSTASSSSSTGSTGSTDPTASTASSTGSTASTASTSRTTGSTGSTASTASTTGSTGSTGSTASGASTASTGSTGSTVTTVATTVSTTTSAAQALIRKTVWLICDPHLYSWNKSYEFCNFTGSQTCLNTTGLNIDCTATAVNGSLQVSYLSALTFTFTNNGTTKTYSVSDASVALTPQFPDASNTVLNSKNSSWLKISMVTNTSTSSSISIIDKNTNTTIMLSQFKLGDNSLKMFNLIVLMTSGNLATSSGILIGGCPSAPAGRRRRSLSLFEEARGSTACDSVTDPILNGVCTADVGATGNTGLAGGVSIAAATITTAQAIDAAAFNAAISSFGIGVNLSLFSIFAFNVYFFFF